MHLLFIANITPSKNGAFESLLVALAERVQAAGDRLTYLFAGDPSSVLQTRFSDAGAEWETVPGWGEDANGRVRPWAIVWPAWRLIRRLRPDVCVMHFGNELPTVVLALLSRWMLKLRPRWIWQQDQQIADPGLLTRWISRLRLLAWCIDGFVATYHGGLRSMRLRGVPEHKIRVICNSITDYQPTQSRSAIRQALGVPETAVLIISAAWLIPRKRLDLALKAVSSLVASASQDIRYVIIGQGPEETALRAQAHALGLTSCVFFAGQRNDVRELLTAADIFLHTSDGETCTYVTTEAMCASLAVVTTDCGAAIEQVENGITGYVCPKGDWQGLVERLTTLVKDPELRQEMGTKARARWSRYYALDNAVAGLLQYFQQ